MHPTKGSIKVEAKHHSLSERVSDKISVKDATAQPWGKLARGVEEQTETSKL